MHQMPFQTQLLACKSSSDIIIVLYIAGESLLHMAERWLALAGSIETDILSMCMVASPTEAGRSAESS